MADDAAAAMASLAICNAPTAAVPSSAPPPAITRVFGIAELGDHILSDLPIKDLLNAKLVSKTWKVLIDAPYLQQALFLKPEKVNEVYTTTSKTSLDEAHYHIVHHLFNLGAAAGGNPAAFVFANNPNTPQTSYNDYSKPKYNTIVTVTGRISASRADPYAPNFKVVRVNTLLCCTSRIDKHRGKREDIDSRATYGEYFDIKYPILRHWYRTHKDNLIRTYLKMYLTQPPTTRVKFTLTRNDIYMCEDAEKFTRMVTNKEGVTLYDILKAYLDILAHTCADLESFFQEWMGDYDARVHFAGIQDAERDLVIIPCETDESFLQARAQKQIEDK